MSAAPPAMTAAAAGGRKPAGERQALAALLLVVFINIAGFGIVIPLLPFYAEGFGVAAWQVTILFSAFSVGQLFGESWWGHLSDRIGRRPVLIGTILAGAIGYFLLAYAPNYTIALLLRLAGGLFAGNISTIQAYVADVSAPDTRTKRMGLIGAIFGLGFVVGPGIGGLLADPAAGLAGFRLPLLVAGGLSAIAAASVLLFVVETRHAVDTPAAASRRAMLGAAWRHPVMRTVILTTMIATGAFSAMEAIFALWAHARYGWGPHEVGLCFAFIGCMSALSQWLLVGRVVDRLGEAHTLTAGLFLTAASLYAQTLAPTGGWMVFVTLFTVIGITMTQPSTAGLISRVVGSGEQGAMLGLNGSASAFARIGGPVLAGFLFSGVGVDAPYRIAALLTVPAALLALGLDRAVRRHIAHQGEMR
ncbi:MAG: MFS transporter [Sphingomonas fennica]